MSRHRLARNARGSTARGSVRSRAAFPVLAAVAAVVFLAVWVAMDFPPLSSGGSDAKSRSGDPGWSATPVTPAAPSPPASASPSPSPSVDPDQVLSEQLAPILKATTASLSVAVLDVEDGDGADYGVRAGTTYDTASVVKVDILAALLLKAQDQGRVLTAQEKTYATSMIQVSDNASADALWQAIGGADGLDAANKRLGLTATTGGSGALWGLTQSTAADQLALLSAVFGDDSDSPLGSGSRTYIQGLMGGVAADQDWGVSAAGAATGLKNGWLARSATGLWDINSIGRIVADGHGYLVAVLSSGSVSKEAGISLVEKAAKTAVAVSASGDSA
ncbi:class A beta-lactamase-related serine hydrolase [Streptomyces scopuliridis]|uniref:Class A beta-lactamase-related serine hydrolase n=1 Tax=Streptomyces scopuliridis TaxID=452529 RepID=A0ACD4ZM60_9ACTN|nr:hypothetical protein [Streptomyces scopuliridis]WSB34639.1 class A beta-lactamase-related serine hydrolase [Streptomyces scopuliridis]WSB98886.1 class A beta-lactamase-related serine hydrolase [Streptomyces scopuliridis]WSC07411.1 class A beta-lactamase-related serine hydrolase [Streptomyces scopuliridis]